MKKQLTALCLVLALIFATGMVAPVALAAGSPAETSNINDQNYTVRATPISSHLVDNGDGTFTRVEYTGEYVTVETYDSDLAFVDGFSIEMELPIFGGFHFGEEYNFLIFGQENPNEDDTAEVVRVVSYTKDWERVGAASLFGANTYIPFDAGSLRCAEYNGYLYIRTAHEMYMSDDGYHHQANMTLNVRISDMVITDSFYDVMNVNYGYVSHSFNQFIAVDGTDLLAVDHGDAYPRSVVLIKYGTAAGGDTFTGRCTYVNVLPIAGSTGANATGVSVGGFEISDSAYLIAGNTVSHGDDYSASGQRNIFITATSKENFTSDGTTVHYLTSYTEDDGISLSTPHFFKVEDNKYAILWTESGSETSILRYAFVDGSGELLSEVYTAAGVLSDCQPIVSGGKLIWYVTSASAPAFFTIDPENPGSITHDHIYTYSYVSYPGYSSAGSLSCVCAVCGEAGENVTIPAIKGSSEYTIARVDSEPTCTAAGYGYYRWNYLSNYDVTQYIFGGTIPALGHELTHVEGVSATCTAEGSIEHWDCSRCGVSYADEACTTAVTDFTAAIDPDNHTGGTELVDQTDATCTTAGYTGDTVCSGCGAVITGGTVIEAPGHAYKNGACTRCGEADPIFRGDLDGDKKLTVTDMMALKQLILSGSVTEEERLIADVNEDGNVNAIDIVRLKLLILAG